MVRSSGSRSSAVSFVTEGTYQREEVAHAALSFVAGTEMGLNEIESYITTNGSTRDELFSWVRANLFVYHATGKTLIEWAVVRIGTADALPDLNDASEIEKLHKEGRILKRGLLHNPDPDAGPLKLLKFELFNVRLPLGDELRLVIRPIVSGAASDGYIYGIVEYRQVGE